MKRNPFGKEVKVASSPNTYTRKKKVEKELQRLGTTVNYGLPKGFRWLTSVLLLKFWRRKGVFFCVDFVLVSPFNCKCFVEGSFLGGFWGSCGWLFFLLNVLFCEVLCAVFFFCFCFVLFSFLALWFLVEGTLSPSVFSPSLVIFLFLSKKIIGWRGILKYSLNLKIISGFWIVKTMIT